MAAAEALPREIGGRDSAGIRQNAAKFAENGVF